MTDTPKPIKPIKPTPQAAEETIVVTPPEAPVESVSPQGVVEVQAGSQVEPVLGPPVVSPMPGQQPTLVPRLVATPVVDLRTEMIVASLGGFVAGLGSFVGALTVGGATTLQSFESALIGGGVAAITFFANSLRLWYQQKYPAAI